tara:strand:+ start:12213 stop:12704 length:492 start_codon:yes stop_codon:yes gene_type:complete
MTDNHEIVRSALEAYTDRGLFRGLSPAIVQANSASFKVLWHYSRTLNLRVDYDAGTMVFENVLPDVPTTSPMYRELVTFVANLTSDEIPVHRRVDRSLAVLACENVNGDASIHLTLTGSDYKYATQKLVQTVHEVYLDFLISGPYYEYMVGTLGLNPDTVSFA